LEEIARLGSNLWTLFFPKIVHSLSRFVIPLVCLRLSCPDAQIIRYNIYIRPCANGWN
jgi:hypothetical protein